MHKALFQSVLAASLTVCACHASDATTPRPWSEYHPIMWIGDSVWKDPARVPLFFQRLREMGIDTAMVFGDGDPKPLVENHFPYYIENTVNQGLCLKFNSNVRDWDKFVTDWARNGRPESAFVRDYSLDDPEWKRWASDEVRKVMRKNAPNRPIAHDLRDELSTTYSANPFDYDFSPTTLAAFRTWLQSQYKDLAALNREWETQFTSWDEVKPFSTDQIKNRMASGDAIPRGKPDWQAVQAIHFTPANAASGTPVTRWNFAPWCDFRTYMDISLARALNDLRQASHETDPQTPVGIEGTQMPNAFGGYDLWRLSHSLDWVEPYDIGNAREIFGSFMPNKPLLTTVFESQSDPASRRLWHLLLEGDRGCIIWWSEDCIDWSSKDYALTPKAKALAPVLKEMTSPLARLFLRAKREYDPIGICYSQSSLQVDWLLESTVDGSTWPRRFSSFEADHNRMARVRNAWLKAFQDLGYSPRFVAPEQVAANPGALTVLVLPNQLTAGPAEQGFLKTSNAPQSSLTLFYDGTPGLFDEHGKLRDIARSAGEMPPSEKCSSAARNGTIQRHEDDIASYVKTRLSSQPSFEWPEWIEHNVSIPREITLPKSARARVHRFTLGKARLVAIERNIDYQMSEDLKQAGGNEELEKPLETEAKLPAPVHVYDLRTGKYLGMTGQIKFRLDPWKPSLFALLTDNVPETDLIDRLSQ